MCLSLSLSFNNWLKYQLHFILLWKLKLTNFEYIKWMCWIDSKDVVERCDEFFFSSLCRLDFFFFVFSFMCVLILFRDWTIYRENRALFYQINSQLEVLVERIFFLFVPSFFFLSLSLPISHLVFNGKQSFKFRMTL